jgi:hypothetical protein
LWCHCDVITSDLLQNNFIFQKLIYITIKITVCCHFMSSINISYFNYLHSLPSTPQLVIISIINVYWLYQNSLLVGACGGCNFFSHRYPRWYRKIDSFVEVVKIANMYGKYVVFVPFKHYTSNCDVIVTSSQVICCRTILFFKNLFI